jgi:hypothetical protein
MATTEKTTKPAGNAYGQIRLVGFVLLHAALLTSGLAWARFRMLESKAERRLPTAQNEPITVTPQRNVPAVILDEQLQSVLYKLRPRLRGRNPKINHVDHALRFWGVEATFDDPECLSGIEMREILVDNRQFKKVWQADARPFLMKSQYGVRMRLARGAATASHEDHTLACLAEVGTPLDYPVITEDGETTVRALLDEALQTFSLNQKEYEWSTLIFGSYLPTDRTWFTTEGQQINFDRLARRIMRQKLVQGVCYGNHRLHTLAMLLRIDEQKRILSPAGRGEIIAHLQSVTKTLIANQTDEGYWNPNWDGSPASELSTTLPPLTGRILATGHALEWWALAPKEIDPPLETIVPAGQWLVRTIEGMSEREIQVNYTFLTHAGRALALWRGKLPAEVDLQPSPSATR